IVLAVSGARRQRTADLLDAPAVHAHVAVETATFVDDIGVADQPVVHERPVCGVPGGRRSVKVSGTGSKPPRHPGWQRASRPNASKPPRAAPKRATATRA